jgi:hypothetical protein
VRDVLFANDFPGLAILVPIQGDVTIHGNLLSAGDQDAMAAWLNEDPRRAELVHLAMGLDPLYAGLVEPLEEASAGE